MITIAAHVRAESRGHQFKGRQWGDGATCDAGALGRGADSNSWHTQQQCTQLSCEARVARLRFAADRGQYDTSTILDSDSDHSY